MKSIVSIASAAALLSFVSADIPGDIVCPSACGLFASSDQCRDKGTSGNFCSSLEKMPGGKVRFNPGHIKEGNRLTIKEAQALVQAPGNNCFAMYYERHSLRSEAAYCTWNNVCPKLFWDKLPEGQVIPASDDSRKFRFANTSEDNFNSQSAVLCDFASSKKPPVTEDKKDGRDPCKSLCALSHNPEECKLVERQLGLCDRLFWTNSDKNVTVFSVYDLVGSQQVVRVEEARDLLQAPENDCATLCLETGTCAERIGGSFCGESRTCQHLFFQPKTGLEKLSVCFAEDENCRGLTDTPVHCRLPSDAPSKGFHVPQANGHEISKKGSTAAPEAGQVVPLQGATRKGQADETTTRTTDFAFGISVSGALVVVLVSFI